MKRFFIIGATSAIAIECARKWVNSESEFFLVGRNQKKLEQVRDDLISRGAARVLMDICDMNDFNSHPLIIDNFFDKMTSLDVALIAHGTLPGQDKCQLSVETALKEFSSNGLSVIAFLTLLSNRLEEQGSGSIAVISSVAGDRGRPSNYLYGSAKSAVTTFCEGLRARLYKSGVHLMTIKPGFVDTPMTAGLELPKALTVSAENVASRITIALEKKRNSIYVPVFWWGIMFLIKSIPEAIFKRLNL